ncbi:signal transduction histidine kinase with CheB and CheR activity [Caballeronia sordidicola]|uniref:Signal transduction histidine kinase with CheB and CheR activity n=1 Tax=Caballeronia sordidicola TaxID=196367 RepID=A0A158I2E6_CABSO|nr:chemotaxis protein CheB [Caballeronia sordidicola]SAL50291.1 signal transduction histidine kinase with CheB and CheR activity [Caballeronia sordidicola]
MTKLAIVPANAQSRSFPIVGIGASAGGLQAVSELIGEFSAECALACLVVIHLDPEHESSLSEILARHTPLHVVQAADAMAIETGCVYVIPPAVSMSVKNRRIRLRPRDMTMGPPMPIDDLLDSLAKDQGTNAIGVILSGSGSDGVLGLQSIHSEGGITLAQDEATAAFTSMPRLAVAQGCVDLVLPPVRIGQEICRMGMHPHLALFRLEQTPRVANPSEESLTPVFRLLNTACKIDFSHYKRGTIYRRLSRRMALHRVTQIDDYVALLRSDPAEALALGRDLLIRVTEFFRDPEAFDALTQRVFPRLFDDSSAAESIRIWVPGCASGEEVYSIAICMFEYLGEHGIDTKFQIFGTDISDDALHTARAGRYIENIARNVSPERLERFFVREGQYYKIEKYVRDVCTFARHNVAADPPFSRMDLISCRNLLIYLDPLLQRNVMPLFHYALKANGILMLGPSESVGSFSSLFGVIESKRTKLYNKRAGTGQSAAHLLSLTLPSQIMALPGRVVANKATPTHAQRLIGQAEAKVLARYAPPFVICDGALNIVEFRGDTTPYLVNPNGPPSTSLQRLAKPDIFLPVSQAIREANMTGTVVRKPAIRLSSSEGSREANLEVHPIQSEELDERWFLIFFEDATSRPTLLPALVRGSIKDSVTRASQRLAGRLGSRSLAQKDAEIARLTAELAASRDQIRSMLEDHESAREELKSSEEELLSSNEEFQSTNEELETTRAELQSINEELSTSNEELRYRNDELRALHNVASSERDYADSLFETIFDPLLVLDADLRIVRANNAFYETFQTKPEATIDAKLFALGNGQWDSKALKALLEEILPEEQSVRNFFLTHEFPALGLRTMRLNATRVQFSARELVLLTINDVTDQNNTLNQLQAADRNKDEFLAMLAHELRNPLAAIRNGLNIWERGNADLAIEGKARAIAQRQLDHEIGLVDDLLDVSRITRGVIKLKRMRTNVVDLARHAIDAMQPEIERHQHTVAVSLPEEPLWIEGDPLRIEQIVTNLLGNAIKYTPAHGRIEITLAKEAQQAVLKISDNGIGMHAALLPTIFTIFVQADSSLDRKASGLGIGLALVSRLTELHGGSVQAFSEGLNKGSQFVVRFPTLPASVQSAIRDVAVQTVATEITPKKILVVDDNVDAAESTAMFLRLDRHDVRLAADGLSALATAQEFQPDVVLLDIGLPDIDGYEVAKRLRESPDHADTVLIALSGYGQDEHVQRSRLAGFDHHLVKPADLKILDTLISTRRGDDVR